MKNIIPIACMVGVFLAGCGGAPSSSSPAAAAPAAKFPAVHDLEGRPVRLETFLDGDVDYMLLVATESGCGWSRKFAEEIRPLLPELKKLRVRPAFVLAEGKKGDAAAWSKFGPEELGILVDEDRAFFQAYVKTRSPSINVVDPTGTVVMAVDGYIAPRTLIDKIERKAFLPVPSAGG